MKAGKDSAIFGFSATAPNLPGGEELEVDLAGGLR